jgi:hypothetical protein
MMCEIEDRALEIAKDFGKSYRPCHLIDIYFNHDNLHEYVVAEFCEEFDGEEKFEHFTFNKDWLFSDDYKNEIATKEAKRKAEEEAEYHEYLRLKAKFEDNCDD